MSETVSGSPTGDVPATLAINAGERLIYHLRREVFVLPQCKAVCNMKGVRVCLRT